MWHTINCVIQWLVSTIWLRQRRDWHTSRALLDCVLFSADAIWQVSTVIITNMYILVECVDQINGSFHVWTHQHNSIRTRFVEYFMLIMFHPVGVLTRFTLTHSSPFHKSQSLFNPSLIRVVKWRKYPLPSWNCEQLPFHPCSRVYKIEETSKVSLWIGRLLVDPDPALGRAAPGDRQVRLDSHLPTHTCLH